MTDGSELATAQLRAELQDLPFCEPPDCPDLNSERAVQVAILSGSLSETQFIECYVPSMYFHYDG
eukprot:1102301-Ditylum_brightwellii.AAC.1